MAFIHTHPQFYYNEFDPGAAAWLRELIRAGLIADGEVDERSILDVSADDLRGFTQVHFFAGIGGWSYALRLAGWPDDRPVWTGSPPCQPFSAAGKQKGRDDARHLAPHFINLVGAARPGVLFGEQVASADVFGKATKRARGNFVAPPQWAWIDDLSDRLEAARYAVGASDFPSAGVGAPHIRQRTFFGAVSHEWMADAECRAAERHGQPVAGTPGGMQGAAREQRLRPDTGHGIDFGGMVHGLGAGLEGHGGHGDGSDEPGRLDQDATGSTAAASADGRLADQSGSGWREERQNGRGGAFGDCPEGFAAGLGAGRGDSGLADQHHHGCGALPLDRLHDAEHHAEPRGSHSGMGHNGGPGPLHGFWSDADWLLCRDGKWRPVEPGTFPLAHGVSGRVGLLRGYGNAINPHAAAEFIRAFGEGVETFFARRSGHLDAGCLTELLT